MIAIISGAMWFFNFCIVLGGYFALLIIFSIGVRKRTDTQHLLWVSTVALIFALVIAYFLLTMLVSELPVKELYIFTAFTEITWRPFMLWLAVGSATLYTAAYQLFHHKTAFLVGSCTALVGTYVGIAQAVAGLFFGNDIFRAYGIQLHY